MLKTFHPYIVALTVLATATPMDAALLSKEPRRGCVVVALSETGSMAERLGFREGDVLVSWDDGASPKASARPIDSPFYWSWLGLEYASRDDIRIEVIRGTSTVVLQKPEDLQGLGVRPWMSEASLEGYRTGIALFDAKEYEAAIRTWNAMVDAADRQAKCPIRSWLTLEATGRLFEAGQPATAQELFENAKSSTTSAFEKVALHIGLAKAHEVRDELVFAIEAYATARELALEVAVDSPIATYCLSKIGDLERKRGNLKSAQRHLKDALVVQEDRARGRLAVADTMSRLGIVASHLGSHDRAQLHFERALAIRTKRAPESRLVAQSINSLSQVAMARGDLDKARTLLEQARVMEERFSDESVSLAKVLINLSNVTSDMGDLDESGEYLQRALTILEGKRPNSLVLAACLANLGNFTMRRGNLEVGAEHYRRALGIIEKVAPGTLAEAKGLNMLGAAETSLGNLPEAKNLLVRAQSIFEQTAPNSIDFARVIHALGNLSFLYHDLSAAEVQYRRALSLKTKLSPGNLALAPTLMTLGRVLSLQGKFPEAEEQFFAAKRIHQRYAPSGLGMAANIEHLGLLSWKQGDLAIAEHRHRSALNIRLAHAPHSLATANSLNNLGIVAFDRGDFDLSLAYAQRALAIRLAIAPKSLDVATSYSNIGNILTRMRDLDASEQFHEQALRIHRQEARASLNAATSLSNLGHVALERGQSKVAAAHYGEALEIRTAQAPGSLAVARSLIGLGRAVSTLGQQTAATVHLEQALSILQARAPGSLEVAESLKVLGDVRSESDDPRAAARLYERAIEAIEQQLGRLGASYDQQSRFRSEQSELFHRAPALRVSLNQHRAAFYLIERTRAQSFLSRLAARDIPFADLPPELDAERRSLRIRYDQTLSRMEDPAPTDQENGASSDRLQEQLLLLRERQQRVEVEIRERFPAHAAFQYPEPLAFEAVREALDPGTVLLTYSVGEEKTLLFVIRKDHELAAHTITTNAATLRAAVADFRVAIEGGRFVGEIGEYRRAWTTTLGRSLFDTILGPAREAIEKGARVLLLPDGPLHFLPFGALVQPDGRYVIEAIPLHVAQSATTWALLKAKRLQNAVAANPLPEPISTVAPPTASCSRNDPPHLSLLAFGNPRYPQGLRDEAKRIADVPTDERIETRLLTRNAVDQPGLGYRVRSALERGLFDWSDLPATGTEVAAIRPLMDDGSARVFVGADATEEAFKTWAGGARILHVAAHAHIDDRFPWNSALVLSIPESFEDGRDNGLLQVWEIMESVRLPNADLVVLSACSTAVGDEQGGEGIVGLTRAFQFAGARTVAASLWNVADDTTAALMERFYQHLAADKPKDEALQAAQIEFIRGPVTVTTADGRQAERDASAPYYWAAFQLYGDWQ